MTEAAKSKPINILIVGDWVIDEYWFLVRHHSEISTHTGLDHFRISITDPETDSYKDLCGAGHIARVLHDEISNDEKYNIYGIGKWNKADTEYIEHLVHSRDEKIDCPAPRVTNGIGLPELCKTPPSIKLTTLDDESQTIRVIRQYYQKVDGIQQISRVDWEKQFDKTKDKGPNYKTIKELIQEGGIPEKVDLIIVHDLVKGVVDPDLIGGLAEKFPDALWCVRSKAKTPEWLKKIPDKKIGLYVIGPEIASQESPIPSWVINGNISDQAMHFLGSGDKKGQHNSVKGMNVALLTENREIIAYLKEKNGQCVIVQSTVKPDPISEMGWASAVEASLIFQFIKNDWKLYREPESEKIKEVALATEPQSHKIGSGNGKNVEGRSLEEEVAHSLYGYGKGRSIQEAVATAESNGTMVVPKSIGLKRPDASPPLVSSGITWGNETAKWKDSKSKYGIINFDNTGDVELVLDIWRGSTHLPGYIACIKKKQDILDDIGKLVKRFRTSAHHSRSLSILLNADPGAGKSSLAKALAGVYKFNMYKFDITQMIHRDDLLDLFDTVSSEQANGVENMLIFVDEINAKLANDHVYSAFLAPLEEGQYIRNGRTNSLKPAVWIFAGTNSTSGIDIEKESDFRSRMTEMFKIDLTSLREHKEPQNEEEIDSQFRLESQAKLEQIYLGAHMIKMIYPDVTHVSLEVLDYFYRLENKRLPAREIRKLVNSLKNVQYGSITRIKNCGEWEDWKDNLVYPHPSGPGRLVKIG